MRRDTGGGVTSLRSGNAADARLPPRPEGCCFSNIGIHMPVLRFIPGHFPRQQNVKLFLREP
jgi:hypothetical protein